MSVYGEAGKKIVFYDSEKNHAELKIRLHYDGLTQSAFFREVVAGYVAQDENIVKFIEITKEQKSTQSKKKMKKISNMNASKKKTIQKFALDENEIENIFDILEEECPDL
jgi:hypothetical protein|tara:strand:+ start:198 stop:527 length:330 start_codon:yes stop_codon:yes gene_type:complete